jgi:hypothetical protein
MILRNRKPKNPQEHDRNPTEHLEVNAKVRIIIAESEDSSPDHDVQSTRIERIKQAQQGIHVDEFMTYDQYGIIRREDRIVLPSHETELVKEIIERIHDRNHRGIGATTREISDKYIWKT